MCPPRVLVIDDERLLRWSLREKLSDSGYAVVCAGSGEEGLRRFEEGGFPVVLLDLRLPGVGGREVLRRLLLRDPAVRVVVITAGDVEVLSERLRREGAFSCIGKPFAFPELLHVLSEALGASAGA